MQRPTCFALLLSLAVPTLAIAQTPRGLREIRDRSVADLGLGLVAGQGVGEFGDLLGKVVGANADLTANLGRHVGLRFEGAYVQYGDERRFLPLWGPGGGYDRNTYFYITSVRAGPQITLGTGRTRLYVFGTAGGAYFATRTSFGDYHDSALSLSGGGGLRMNLSRSLALVLGGSYVHNDRVSYLRSGDIVTNPDGTLTFNPIQSAVDFATVDVGLKFGL